MAADATATATAARGTLLSVGLRLLSFLLSQLTVRMVPVAALGRASVPLELLLSTTLFVGREGFRLALTKEGVGHAGGGGDTVDAKGRDTGNGKDEARRREQQTINASWLAVPIGAALSLLALLMHLHKCHINSGPSANEAQDKYSLLDYKISGALYCLAALVESLSEPLVLQCLRAMDLGAKAKAEGAALVMKSLSCFACLHLTRQMWFVDLVLQRGDVSAENRAVGVSFAVTAFGISQLVYATIFTLIMYRKATLSAGGIRWPRRIQPPQTRNPYRKESSGDTTTSKVSPNLDPKALRLVLAFTLQGLFKHALTEADRIVLSALAGAYDQGVYALAASYGGLAARMLLQPAEENARLLFSRQGARIDGGDETKERACDLLEELEATYFTLLRLVLHVGLLFAAFGTNYTSLLLRVLAGAKWGTNPAASEALSAFCVYTACLALNGTAEAFVYGVARRGRDIGRLGAAHAAVGGAFALAAPGLVRRHGAVGLVAANGAAMALRAAYALWSARGYFARAGGRSGNASDFSRMLPRAVVVAAFGISFAVTRLSRIRIYDGQIAKGKGWTAAGLQHVGVGVLCAIATAAVTLWKEKELRSSLSGLLKRKNE